MSYFVTIINLYSCTYTKCLFYLRLEFTIIKSDYNFFSINLVLGTGLLNDNRDDN